MGLGDVYKRQLSESAQSTYIHVAEHPVYDEAFGRAKRPMPEDTPAELKQLNDWMCAINDQMDIEPTQVLDTTAGVDNDARKAVQSGRALTDQKILATYAKIMDPQIQNLFFPSDLPGEIADTTDIHTEEHIKQCASCFNTWINVLELEKRTDGTQIASNANGPESHSCTHCEGTAHTCDHVCVCPLCKHPLNKGHASWCWKREFTKTMPGSHMHHLRTRYQCLRCMRIRGEGCNDPTTCLCSSCGYSRASNEHAHDCYKTVHAVETIPIDPALARNINLRLWGPYGLTPVLNEVLTAGLHPYRGLDSGQLAVRLRDPEKWKAHMTSVLIPCSCAFRCGSLRHLHIGD